MKHSVGIPLIVCRRRRRVALRVLFVTAAEEAWRDSVHSSERRCSHVRDILPILAEIPMFRSQPFSIMIQAVASRATQAQTNCTTTVVLQ